MAASALLSRWQRSDAPGCRGALQRGSCARSHRGPAARPRRVPEVALARHRLGWRAPRAAVAHARAVTLRFSSDAELSLDRWPAVTVEDRYRRVMRWMIATKTAAPMIDHRIPKDCPLTWTTRGSASLSWWAIQGPTRAPMKPRTMETMNPPRTSPAMALPRAPQTAAMMMSTISPGNVMVM